MLETGGTALLESHQYDVYGVPLNTSDSLFRYTGQIQIRGTDLYHYKARAYHPNLGRFLQTDPIGYDDGMNMYAYVGNDPVNSTDPSGMYTSGGLLPNSAMYELYGKEEAQRNVNAINKSQAAGHAAGFVCVVGCSVVATRLTKAYREYRFKRRMEQVRRKLKDWDETPNRSREPGGRFQDPNDKGNRVRVDKGKPEDRRPWQREDHVVEQRNGRTVDVDGNEIQSRKPTKTREAHIPLEEWLKSDKP